MQRDPRAFLWDVRESALAIQTFTSGMDSTAYVASEMAQAAVGRTFEIIGEALSQFLKSSFSSKEYRVFFYRKSMQSLFVRFTPGQDLHQAIKPAPAQNKTTPAPLPRPGWETPQSRLPAP
jgi:hypothetical protein